MALMGSIPGDDQDFSFFSFVFFYLDNKIAHYLIIRFRSSHKFVVYSNVLAAIQLAIISETNTIM